MLKELCLWEVSGLTEAALCVLLSCVWISSRTCGRRGSLKTGEQEPEAELAVELLGGIGAEHIRCLGISWVDKSKQDV